MAPNASLVEAAEAATDLNYVLRLMHWSGTMPHPRAGKCGLIVFNVFKAAIHTFQICLICSESVILYRTNLSDINYFTFVLSIIITNITWFSRLVHLTVRKYEFHKLALQMRHDFADFLSWRDVPLLEARSRRVRRFLQGFLSLVALGVVMWTHNPHKLQYELALPYDVTQPFAFSATWIICAYLMFSTGIMCNVTDGFNVSVIDQLRLQLIVLSRNILELCNDVDESEPGSENENKPPFEYMSENYSILQKRLRKVLQHHQAIIRNVELVETCLSGILLAQSLSIGTAICFQLFELALSTNDLQRAGKSMAYIIIIFCQIFLYCWFGDDLMSENENVAFASYEAVTTLQGCPMPITRSLLLLMVRAQRPLRITAAGLFELSRESLISILNISYSFFAILRQFREE